MRLDTINDAVTFAYIDACLGRLLGIVSHKEVDAGSSRLTPLQRLRQARAWRDKDVAGPIHDLSRQNAGGRSVN
jgi:hypothetical protein